MLGFKSDAERPLTDEGMKEMKKIARGMEKLGLRFDRVLSSPYVRARQTAEIVAKILDMEDKLQLCEFLKAEEAPQTLILALKKMTSSENVLLVGHEPFLSGAISILLTGRTADVAIDMKKGGLCKLEVDFSNRAPVTTLKWLLTPRQLVFIGKAE